MKLTVASEVARAIASRQAVVALESTVIAHGLPRPLNLETARALEREVRDAGATPATIALAGGAAVVGVDDELLTRLATADDVAKASVRDLAKSSPDTCHEPGRYITVWNSLPKVSWTALMSM